MGNAGADMSRSRVNPTIPETHRCHATRAEQRLMMPRAVEQRRMANGGWSLRRGPFRRQLSIVTVVSPSEVPELEDRVRVRRAQAASRYNVIVQRYSRIVGWRFACWSQRA